jgi:hypothetical protein
MEEVIRRIVLDPEQLWWVLAVALLDMSQSVFAIGELDVDEGPGIRHPSVVSEQDMKGNCREHTRGRAREGFIVV